MHVYAAIREVKGRGSDVERQSLAIVYPRWLTFFHVAAIGIHHEYRRAGLRLRRSPKVLGYRKTPMRITRGLGGSTVRGAGATEGARPSANSCPHHSQRRK